MGDKSTIIKNPVTVKVRISKSNDTIWKIIPQLIAFPAPQRPIPRNIIFILDTSRSMEKSKRLIKVKEAVLGLLNQLNSIDTFSIISFNDDATVLIERKKFSEETILSAKIQIQNMKADGTITQFTPAFQAVNTHGLIQQNDNSTIIFLTDGEDTCATTVKTLLESFGSKFPRVIPIGVFVKRKVKVFLNDLSHQSGGPDQAIYVDDNSQDAYKNAFQAAIQLTNEPSQTPTQLEMTIEAENGTQLTQLVVKRTLSRVHYDGRSPTFTDLCFDSPTPPHSLKLAFRCDNAFLKAEYKVTPAEQTNLEKNHVITVSIPKFKWKDNSARSWAILAGSLTLGLLMLGGAVVFAYLSLLKLGLTIAISAFVGLAGICLSMHGIINLVRKTLFLPTKFAADPAQGLEEKEEKNEVFKVNVNVASAKLTKRSTGLSSKSIFAGSILAAGGGAAGYFGGTAAATSAATALGISASLFIGVCTAGGTIVLPLLAYWCIGHNNPASKTGYSYKPI
jgi:hypothetical protein